jgi:5-carboxymethyl-2-hydroxymuconate isomerase
MPHVMIECSENMLDALRQKDVAKQTYDVMQQSGLFKAPEIKVRIHAAADSYIGPEGRKGSFVHAQIFVTEGRPLEIVKNLAASLFAALRQALPEVGTVTVDVTQRNKEIYQKP